MVRERNGRAPHERWSLKQHCIKDSTQRRHVPATFCRLSASTLALRTLGCGNHLLFHTCRRVNRPAQNHGNWQECEKEKSQSPGLWASLLRLKQGWCPGWESGAGDGGQFQPQIWDSESTPPGRPLPWSLSPGGGLREGPVPWWELQWDLAGRVIWVLFLALLAPKSDRAAPWHSLGG